MNKKLMVLLLLIALTPGCGTFQKTKDYVKENTSFGDNPLEEASRKESLNEARGEVVSAKKAYHSCMDKNGQDVYECVPERERYDATTDRYIKIQQSSN